MRAKDAVGHYGERVAAAHLVRSGLTILDRNWRCSTGELDLVAREGAVLVFCEVKTRSSRDFGDPVEAVVRTKAARIRRLAVRWLAARRDGVAGDARPEAWPDIRFDVVSVLCNRSGAATVEHVRGAF